MCDRGEKLIEEGRPDDADAIRARVDGLQEKWRELSDIASTRYEYFRLLQYLIELFFFLLSSKVSPCVCYSYVFRIYFLLLLFPYY